MNTIINFRNQTIYCLTLLWAVFACGSFAFADTKTWVGNTNNKWSTASNWEGGVAPVANDSLVFGAAGTSGVTLNNDSTAHLNFKGITFTADAPSYTIAANWTRLTGNIVNNSANAQTLNLGHQIDATSTINAAAGDINILKNNSINVNGNSLTITGAHNTKIAIKVSGNGSSKFYKTGTGTLDVAAAWAYTGAITISEGIMQFSANDTFGIDTSTPSVTINVNGGTLASNNKFTTLNKINLAGGTINSGGGANADYGAFLIKGAITVSGNKPSYFTQTTGKNYNGIHLNNNTINVADVGTGDDLIVSATLRNYPKGAARGFTKTGAGTMRLEASNAYTGTTTISAGQIVATNAKALGTGAVTINQDGTLNWNNTSDLGNKISGAGTLKLTQGRTSGYDYGLDSQLNNFTGTIDLCAPDEGTRIRIKWEAGINTEFNKVSLVKISSGNEFWVSTKEASFDSDWEIAGTGAGAGGDVSPRGALRIEKNAVFTGNVSLSADASIEPRFTDTVATFSGNIDLKAHNLTVQSDYQINSVVLKGNIQSTGGTGSLINGTGTTADTMTLKIGDTTAAGSATTQTIGVNIQQNNTVSPLIFQPGENRNIAVSGIISGAGAFEKTGVGTLTLSAANTYTGATTISEGQIIATNAKALGTGTVTNNSELEFNLATSGTNEQVISGTGAVTKTGAGALTLSGENTYTGTTTITGGRIIATNASALGTNNVTNNSQLEFNLGTDETYNKVISGTGAVIKTGAGTLYLSKNNTFTGGMTISEGKVSVPTIYTGLGDGALTLETGATLMIFGGALKETLTISGAATLNGTLDLSEYLTTWDTSKEYTLMTTGSIVNTTGLTLSGVGTGWGWEQSENNILLKYTAGTLGWNWTGATGSFMTAANWENTKVPEATSDVTITKADGKAQIDADTVVNSVTLGTASNLQFTAGKTLTAQTVTMGGTDALNLTGGNLTLTNAPAFDITNSNVANKSTLTLSTGAYANVLSGNTNLTKTGTGTLTLSGVNTYTGTTTVSGGTLALTVDNAIASSASVENNAAISFGNTAQTFKALTGSGTITGSGALTLLNDTNTSYSGTITGDASVTKNDAGTLTLSGANTYTGTTTVNAGKLVLTGNANLESSEGVIIAAGAEMDLSGMAGTQQYNVISSAGTIKGNSSTVLDIDVAASQVRTLTGSVSGIASINKTGNGTLKMNLGQETAPLTVGEIASTAGRLNMQGYYFANISIQGGTFSPGMDLVGKINQLGKFVLSDEAVLELNLVGKNGSNFTFDQLNVSGNVEFSNDSEITFLWNNILPNANGTFDLVTASVGTITYSDNFNWNTILTNAGMDINLWSVEGSPHALTLVYSGGGGGGGGDQSVPEPSTWALLILGALGMMYFRRKK